MKSTPGRPLVVGHRGWPARFPDNTLGGLMAAASVADMVQVDVRRSRDGKLVMSHDPALAGHLVAERTWAFLGDLDLGDGHRPALLDEALAALPTTPVQIEIKNRTSDPGFEPDHRLALEAADRARPGDLIISINWATVERVRQVYPEVATGLIVLLHDALDEAMRRCLDVENTALVPHHGVVDELIEVAIARQVPVFPWTVNDPERARELAALGVTGIITDHPDLIREAL